MSDRSGTLDRQNLDKVKYMASAKIQARLLKGFRDYLPSEMIPRTEMLNKVEAIFQSYGFAPLKTPALEYRDVLMGKYGDEGDKLLYSFEDNGGRMVAMRYDLTVPLARVVAQYPELERPFKRYQIDTVWRAEKPGRGRFREFSQCDVDIIGSDSTMADAECICVIASVLNGLGVNRFVIKVNNRKLLNGLLARYHVTGMDKVNDTLRIIDKLDKIGTDGVVELLASEQDWSTLQAREMLEQLHSGANDLEYLKGLPETSEGANRLAEVMELALGGSAGQAVASGGQLVVDLSVARGLDYYTDTIYETNMLDLPGFGSVMSGGRYDDLLGTFTGASLPAVGVSLGVDRLFAGLKELELISEQPGTAPILVTVFPGTSPSTAIATATRLRQEGLKVELYPGAAKLDKQFKYANRKGIEAVLIIGPDEEQAGTVRIKSFTTGEQTTVPAGEAAGYLRNLLAKSTTQV